jgi:hypothetical protein
LFVCLPEGIFIIYHMGIYGYYIQTGSIGILDTTTNPKDTFSRFWTMPLGVWVWGAGCSKRLEPFRWLDWSWFTITQTNCPNREWKISFHYIYYYIIWHLYTWLHGYLVIMYVCMYEYLFSIKLFCSYIADIGWLKPTPLVVVSRNSNRDLTQRRCTTV